MYARMFDCHIRRASQQESELPEPGNVVSDHPPQAPSMNRRSRTPNQTEQALPNIAFGRACSSFLPVQHRNKIRMVPVLCHDLPRFGFRSNRSRGSVIKETLHISGKDSVHPIKSETAQTP